MNKITTYIALSLAMLAASCTSDQLDSNGACTLSGNGEKTPIAVQTNLSVSPTSRAFDKTFESEDKLFAYIEAGKTTEGVFAYEGQFRWVDNFTLGATVDNGGTAGVGNITTTDNLSPTLYWDDFSSTTHDLREEGRGLRLKYGYCFNGGEGADNAKGATVQGNILTALNLETGVLDWKVMTDQSAADAMKHSDLLYAATQPMITYGHDPASRGILTLPYTHAMSKVTINVTTGEGYSADNANFASSVLTLKDMQVMANVNAPAATVTATVPSSVTATVPGVSTSGTANITTYTESKANTTATYQAIIAPTTLTAGNLLAIITNIAGNNYNIPLTDGILTAWSAEDKLVEIAEVLDNGVAQSKSRAGIDHGKSYVTKPGIHYILNVTVDKQKITIRATITDWDSVTAEGKAAINFTGDVTEKGTIADDLKTNGFDVYKNSSASSFTEKSTTVTFADGKWAYTPTLYWAGQSDNSYFRAVSPAGASNSALTQGTDLMWGTSGDEAITPRTGDVALNFDHLMSKLCVKLETSTDAAAVNLTGATIKITNLATTGTYSIVDATVSAGSPAATMLSDKPSDFTEYVVPQPIGNDARLIVTLADGTTYSLQLNKCVLTDTETVVNEWTKGKSYTYTIHLEKETATFRALVKEWDEATGSGNANLEWD